MADKKISELTTTTTPLAGTEVLPIVQSTTTKKVSVANLTAGRSVSMASATLTGGVANGVAYLDSSKNIASSSDLVWDGSQMLMKGNSRLYFTAFTNANDHAGYVGRNSTTGYLELTAQTIGGGYGITFNNYLGELGRWDTAGNLKFSIAGKGIDFSANTNAAGMTSELLNDYEEGTWTVTWANLTGTPGSTTGNYTKIGRLVFFTYYTAGGSISGTGNSVSFSLPFTPAQAAVGAFISADISNAGNILIWTSTVGYPATFSGNQMTFSGTFYV